MSKLTIVVVTSSEVTIITSVTVVSVTYMVIKKVIYHITTQLSDKPTRSVSAILFDMLL